MMICKTLPIGYKTSNADISRCHIRVRLNGQPAIEQVVLNAKCTHQYYSSFLKISISSSLMILQILSGYSAATKWSVMFKVLGSTVGYSIFQNGIGFPHLNEACYWYMAVGEVTALQYLLHTGRCRCWLLLLHKSSECYSTHVLITTHAYIATGIYVTATGIYVTT